MGLDEQTLLGVTGSGKTFTMASHRKIAASYIGARAQQDACGTALLRV